jgi:hypothetical protein
MFKIVAPDTGLLTADVNATSYGPSPEPTASSSLTTAIQSARLQRPASNFASNSEIQFDVTIGQTYYVAVTVDANSGFNPTDPFGRLTNSTANPTDYTLYLSSTTATPTAPHCWPIPKTSAPSVSGSISSTNATLGANGGFKYVDWYSYTAQTAGLLDLAATADTTGFTPNVQMWTLTTDSSGNTSITAVGSVTGSGSNLIDQVTAGQTVYVSVTGAGKPTSTGSRSAAAAAAKPARIRSLPRFCRPANLTSLNDNSIDNGTPQTITVGQAISGNIGTDNGLIVGDTDVDLYKFVPTTPASTTSAPTLRRKAVPTRCCVCSMPTATNWPKTTTPPTPPPPASSAPA